MDREASGAAVHRVTKSRTRLSDWTELSFLGSWSKHPAHKSFLFGEWYLFASCHQQPMSPSSGLFLFCLQVSGHMWLLKGCVDCSQACVVSDPSAPFCSAPNYRELHYPDSLLSAQICPTQTWQKMRRWREVWNQVFSLVLSLLLGSISGSNWVSLVDSFLTPSPLPQPCQPAMKLNFLA